VLSQNEEWRALSFLAIEHVGLKMDDPPPRDVVEKYRDRFETALRTGVDPVAEERRQKAAEAAADKPDADKPGVPAAKTETPAPAKLDRPTAKTTAPAMRL